MLEFVLGRHTKPLFFVDDQQSQVLEFDIIGEKAMGPHNEIDRTVGKTANHFTLLACGEESAQRSDGYRVWGESLFDV